jgi:Ca2+-binding RTX toxin-like protein
MARPWRTRPAHKPVHSSRRPDRPQRPLRLESLEPRLALATIFSPLEDRLEQHLTELPGIGGAAILNLSSGEEAFVNPDQAFGTSSTIKSGILFALARKIDAEDETSWGTLRNVGNSYGANQGSTLVANNEYTLEYLAKTMIVNSNNWATNRLIQFIGMNTINDEFGDTLGLDQTRLNRYLVGTGAPSAHGNVTGPVGDYQEGWDNLSTPREITSMLQQIHENAGLLSNFSYDKYWSIMALDGNGGTGNNTRGYSNDYYGSDGLNGYFGALYPNWAPLMDFYNKAGSNDWTGDPGVFDSKPTLGDHSQRSEAGRVILSSGEVLFYAAFADNATNAGEAEEWIAAVGYEMAFEHANSPVTHTPVLAQLDDGRVLVVHGNNSNNQIVVRTSPTDADNLQVLRSGALTADFDAFDNGAGISRVNRIYVYGNGGDDEIDVPSLPVTALLTVYGGSGHDDIATGPAAFVWGGSGNDVIATGGGADWVNGESGNDSITLGGGVDFAQGGEGDDFVNGGDGADTIDGGDDDDQLNGGNGNDTLYGYLGNDDLIGGNDSDTLHGNEGDDFLSGGNGSDTLYGYEGNDELLGGNDADTLAGDEGNDNLDGGAGTDTLDGDEGSDHLVGGSGVDTLDGGDDNDQLIGGYKIPALNYVLSDASGDTLRGGGGDDAIIADDGNFLPLIVRETVGGNDVITGGSGNDVIFGGSGNDNVQGNVGNDTILAGAGDDTVIGGTFIVMGLIIGDGDDFVNAGTGNDTVYGDNFDPLLPPAVSLVGGNDQIIGGSGNDILFGQAGHDDLDGGLNSDQLDGGVGNDELTGSAAGDILRGGDGTDLMFGNDGNDLLDGGADNDTMVGGTGGDQLFGQAGDDFANGEAGADLVVGGLGIDQLFGGDDNDQIVGGNYSLVGDNSGDTIDGGGGNDLILGDSGTTNPLNTSSPVGGNDTIQGGLGNDTIYAMAGNDFVGGGAGNDVLVLGGGNDIANGDSGDDSLTGGSGDDFMAGSAGIDQLFGNDGADFLIGGNYAAGGVAVAETSADTLDGGNDGDILLGDSWSAATPFDQGTEGGNDLLLGGSGDDLLAGQAGNDRMQAGAGDDVVFAGDGNDNARGDAGNDELNGGPGDDIVRGGDGNDELLGSTGNDILLGDGGEDALTGNEGRDILIGGRDADQMNGNDGDDILIAGTTSFDVSDKSLSLIRAEWTSLHSYVNRVKNLQGKPNPTFAARLNGDVFLKKGTTVLDDDAVDLLTGEVGFDWFLADLLLPAPIDTIADLAAGEEVN